MSVKVELDATRISFVVIVTAVFVLASVMVSIFLMLSKSFDAVNAVFPVKATVSVPELPSILSALVKPVTATNVKVSLPEPPVIVSLPRPAVMTLFPAPPSIMSLPVPPVITSAAPPPVILKAPSVSAFPLNVNMPVVSVVA